MKSVPLSLAVCFSLCAALTTGCPRNPLRSAPTRRRTEPTISVYFHENNTKRKMSTEEYLVGVVAGEMRPNWPRNAYAAQAILARTFTMEFIARGGTRKLHGTDICTDEKHAQAYTTSAITPAIRKAVADTKGIVMLHRGKYVHGWFSASCGGRTTYSREGLAYKGAEPPYISSVECPEGTVIPRSEQRWRAEFTGTEVAAALQKAAGKSVGPAVTKAERLGINQLTHRTARIKLTGAKGTVELPAADLRVAIGPERMRSIWLEELQSGGGSITMAGRGFGHGVGLCQWGAYALAKQGRSAQEIVRHYYPKVDVVKNW
ncbi:MAG: SpoIID/LytB domain-containing protein [Bacteroidota bacterium]